LCPAFVVVDRWRAHEAKHGLAALPVAAICRLDVIEPLLEHIVEWAQIGKR
jgi:hypothetical protein